MASDVIPAGPGVEVRMAGLTSVLLNLPSYLLAVVAPIFIAEPINGREWLPVLVVGGFVLGPVLTLSAIGHALWATRSGRVSRRSTQVAWVATALGGIALVIGIIAILRAFSRYEG